MEQLLTQDSLTWQRSTFPEVRYQGIVWDLTHLSPFAIKTEIDAGLTVDVVVLFSCHTFTSGIDKLAAAQLPASEIYNDGVEVRRLDPIRYQQSQLILPSLVKQLPEQRITVANSTKPNFMTWKGEGEDPWYCVFFEVERDTTRKKRLILRVQSAYSLFEGLTPRQRKAKKVKWTTLIKATYEGRKIRE